ncbi:MAG TPA: Stp1/IreP family PP2C-type Ser/Thr phosphatase [Candidatus Rifleibacterium sp.]|nr:Stp1/IreP family PP2C-type Ser/Thr phosphatase [Candidatus Rifleibacterium sp.]
MLISSLTTTGMVRHNNEDSCLVIPPWSSLAIRKGACLLAVADGMGGQNAGEVASGLAVRAIAEWFESNSLENFSPQLIEEMFATVNAAVWSHAQENPDTKGMGTTMTMMVIKGARAIVGHIGDSRLYRLRGGKLEQLTNDHSLVGEQVRMGKLTPEAARVHPTRHILSRVMGTRQFVVPDIFETELKSSDVLLLCSDGLSGMVEDFQIEELLRNTVPSRAAKKLIEAANQAGGKDNSTVVVAQIEELPVTFPGLFSFARLAKLLLSYGNAGSV